MNIVEFSDIYSWQNYIEISAYESEINDKNRLLRKQARLLAVTEEQEKNKLARDLHDGVGQSLSALKMILGMGQKQAEKSGASGLAQTAEKASALADLSIKEMRNVLNNLKPQILQRDGLQAGLAEMTGNLDTIGEFDCRLVIEDPIPSFDDAEELNIYRLVQEALNNVVKHAEE
ncbi:MAG: histidine kinase [Lentihominibacter sp.]|nr:histidine kinase [Lentihominibacter sp.]